MADSGRLHTASVRCHRDRMGDRSNIARVREMTRQSTAPVVVGFDGSLHAQRALKQGLRIATAFKMRLEAVIAWFDDSDTIERPDESLHAEARAANLLIAAGNSLFGNIWPDWFHVSSYEGDAIGVLLNKSQDAEFLIVGGREKPTFADRLQPSVSLHCADQAHCAVIVTHEGHARTTQSG